MTGSRLLLGLSLVLILAVCVWGTVDTEGLVAIASEIVNQFFESRGWFVMLSASAMLAFCLILAFSPYGTIRLGKDDDRPEFSTPSWIAMLFSAGMGVGLLFWAVAEPMLHFSIASQYAPLPTAAYEALVATNINWGVHAWAIYGTTALVIAYFAYRRGAAMMVSGPITAAFPDQKWAVYVGWVSDFLAIVAIAIGVGGSIAMGVFQVADGIDVLIGGSGVTTFMLGLILVAMVACYVPALLVDLGTGMSRLSNMAMAITIALAIYVIVLGPTQYLMNSVVNSFGEYLVRVIPSGFQTFTFYDDAVGQWFKDWTLTYMVWWIAWGPFVGVFIAQISKGRTIREFVIGVLLAPTIFSIFWFGTFGGIGLFDALRGDGSLLQIAQSDPERVTFELLDRLPFPKFTTTLTVLAGFLFIVTSVVSAAVVLATFAMGGVSEPKPGLKVVWGLLLGGLGVVMILSGGIDAVKKLIALGALPFVFIIVFLMVCLIRGLRDEEVGNARRQPS
ncbi:MAG: BCCT family transporter [Pseudomonadota bacterium]